MVCKQTIKHNKRKFVNLSAEYNLRQINLSLRRSELILSKDTGTLDVSTTTTTTASPPPCSRSPTASLPCVCNRSILSFCCSFSHPPSLAPCAARGLSDQSSRTPDRKERKANSAGKKRRRSPSPPSTPAESRKKGGKKG